MPPPRIPYSIGPTAEIAAKQNREEAMLAEMRTESAERSAASKQRTQELGEVSERLDNLSRQPGTRVPKPGEPKIALPKNDPGELEEPIPAGEEGVGGPLTAGIKRILQGLGKTEGSADELIEAVRGTDPEAGKILDQARASEAFRDHDRITADELETYVFSSRPQPEGQKPARMGSITSFKTAKGSTYEVGVSGVTTRNKAFRAEHGAAEQGPQPTSERTFYVTKDQANLLGEFQLGGPKREIAELAPGKWGIRYLEGKDIGKFERRTIVEVTDEPQVGMIPIELWKSGRQVHFGNEIVSIDGSKPDLPMDEGARMGRMREQGYEPGWYHSDSKGMISVDADKGELGLHIGDKSAAQHLFDRRKKSTKFTGGPKPKLRELAVRGKFAEVPDLHNFDSPVSFIDERNRQPQVFDPAYEKMWADLDNRAVEIWSRNGDDPAARQAWRKAVHDAARDSGLAGWEYKNRFEGGTSRVVFDTTAVRDTKAAFDPAEEGSSRLLAGIGGGMVFTGGLFLTPEEAEAQEKGENSPVVRAGIEDAERQRLMEVLRGIKLSDDTDASGGSKPKTDRPDKQVEEIEPGVWGFATREGTPTGEGLDVLKAMGRGVRGAAANLPENAALTANDIASSLMTHGVADPDDPFTKLFAKLTGNEEGLEANRQVYDRWNKNRQQVEEEIVKAGDALDQFAKDKTKFLGESENIPEALIEGLTQFLTGFIASKKIAGTKAPKTIGGNIASGAVHGTVAENTVMDPMSQSLIGTITEFFPQAKNPLTAFFTVQPDDRAAVARLKKSLEGIGLGVVLDAVVLPLVKAVRSSRDGKSAAAELVRAMEPEQRQQAFEQAAAQLKTQKVSEDLGQLGDPAGPAVSFEPKIQEARAALDRRNFLQVPVEQVLLRNNPEAILARGEKRMTATLSRQHAKRLWQTLDDPTGFEGRAARIAEQGEVQALSAAREFASKTNNEFLIKQAERLGSADEAKGFLVRAREILAEDPNWQALRDDALKGEGEFARAPESETKSGIEINFARIDAPEDVEKIIDDMAQIMGPEVNSARRGVQSFSTTLMNSDEINAWDTLAARRPGEPLNAEQSVAVRELWVSSGRKLREVSMAAAADPSPGNIAAARRMLAIYQAVQSEVISARTETARALSSWRIPVSGTSPEDLKALDDMIGRSGGETANAEFFKRLATADAKTLSAVAERGVFARGADALYSAWINGLLSGPKSHVTNALSGFQMLLLGPLEKAVAGGIRSVTGGEGARAREALTQIASLPDAFREAWVYAGRVAKLQGEQIGARFDNAALNAEADAATRAQLSQKINAREAEIRRLEEEKRAQNPAAFSSGSNPLVDRPDSLSARAWGLNPASSAGIAMDALTWGIKWPGKAMKFSDELFKVMNYRMEVNALAMRRAQEMVESGTVTPAPAQGMVRMYHGGADTTGSGNTLWVTSDLVYAQGYAAKSGKAGKVFYVDIDENDPRLFHGGYADQGPKQGFTASFEMDAVEAAQRRPLNDPKALMAELRANPPEDIRIQGADYAMYQTFTTPPTDAVKSLHRLLGKSPALRLVVPFVNTPANIFRYSLERTPLAPFMRHVRDDIKAGGTRRQMAIARITLGNFALASFISIAASGSITGKGPASTSERQAWARTGAKPYSVKIGDKWVTYNRADPIGFSIGLAADIVEISRAIGDDEDEAMEADMAEIIAVAGGSIAQNILNKSFMSGISDVFEWASDPVRYGSQTVDRMGTSIVPAWMAEVRRQSDPVQREVGSFIDAFRNRIPGLSQTLPARLDMWGREMEYASGLGTVYDTLSPLYVSKGKAEPIDTEMQRLGLYVGMPPKTITYDGVPIKLKNRPKAWSRYLQLSGNELKLPQYSNMGAKDFLNATIEGKSYYSSIYKIYGPERRQKWIRSVVEDYRDAAKDQLLDEFPDIADTVDRAKRDRQAADMDLLSQGSLP
jgi:hypothetical protein